MRADWIQLVLHGVLVNPSGPIRSCHRSRYSFSSMAIHKYPSSLSSRRNRRGQMKRGGCRSVRWSGVSYTEQRTPNLWTATQTDWRRSDSRPSGLSECPGEPLNRMMRTDIRLHKKEPTVGVPVLLTWSHALQIRRLETSQNGCQPSNQKDAQSIVYSMQL
jgi:hypothetical protein